MMREDFAKAAGRRGTFTATFKRFGKKTGFKFPIKTVLLVDVSDNSGQVKTNHLWFTCGKQFAAINMIEGDKIQFVGRITPYEKGYKGNREVELDDRSPVETDYRISFPTKIVNISRGTHAASNSELPLFTIQTKANEQVSFHVAGATDPRPSQIGRTDQKTRAKFSEKQSTTFR